MKIALIEPRASYFIAGSERVSLKHAEHLADLGHEVVLYTSDVPSLRETFFFKELSLKRIEGLSIKKFDVSKRLPGIYDIKPDSKHIRWVAESIAFSEVIREDLSSSAPDIILTYYMPDCLFKPQEIPNIVYILGTPSVEIPAYSSFMQFCDAAISISSIVQKNWKDILSNIKQSYKLPTGVDYPVPITQKILPKAQFNLVFAGRLIERKGVMTLMESFPLILSKRDDVHLWIVGDGELRDELEKKASSLGVKDHITFTGLVSNPSDYFKMADICLFPSHRGDGLMGTVLEAMAAGRPIIATTDNGNEDVMVHMKSGFLVRPYDQAQIAEAALKLLSDENLRHLLGKNAEMYIEKNISWKKHAVNLAKIFEKVIRA
ncbi:MAG TPA: glycosyltransferase family 4 protein [Candidatus Paceibacterota bacterium]